MEKKTKIQIVMKVVCCILIAAAYSWSFVYKPFGVAARYAVYALLIAAGMFSVYAVVHRCFPDRMNGDKCLTPFHNLKLLVFTGLILVFSVSGYSSVYVSFAFPQWDIPFSDVRRALMSTGTLFVFFSCALFSFFLFFKSRAASRYLILSILVTGQLLCALLYLNHNGFTATWTDDNPSFLFRISEFFGSYPYLENYVPHWNAGVVNSVIVSSGTAGYGIFGLPLWLLMPPHIAAPYVYIFVFIFAIPWLTAGALGASGCNRTVSFLGGIFALCMNKMFFLWALHFGTVGAAISWASVTPAFMLLYAVSVRRRVSFPVISGLVFSTFMMAQWPPMLILGLPFGILALISIRTWWQGKVKFVLICTGVVLLLLLWPVVSGSFLSKTVLDHTLGHVNPRPELLDNIYLFCLKYLRPFLLSLNPAVAVAGLCGILFMRDVRLRLWTLFPCIFLLCYSIVFGVYCPNLQAHRMTIPAMCLLTAPAAVFGGKIIGSYSVPAYLKSLFTALVICGVVIIAGMYNGFSDVSYEPLGEKSSHVTGWISKNVPENGRLLFAGPMVHTLGHGHIAYLPVLCGREMMACDYYGFPPGMIEYDYPPARFRKSAETMHSFMAEHAVTHVVTRYDDYANRFEAAPDLFRKVADVKSDFDVLFHFFEVLNANSRIQPAEAGDVTADFNRIHVMVSESFRNKEFLIAYNWNDRFSASAPAEIFSVDMGDGIVFIGIRPNGVSEIDIKYDPVF